LEMTLLVSALILLVFLIILNKASHLTITNAVKVSEITGLGKATVGFILIAFSTSLPELSVSVFSALIGEMGISIGNVLGSNIVNVCLIVGFAALFVALKSSESLSMIPSFAKAELESLYFGLFIASIIPLSLMYLAYASRFVGLILIVVFVVYTYQLSRIRIPSNERVFEGERQKLRRYEYLTFAGVMGVILSSYFIVEYASNIAEIIGVPKTLLGATIIAFGTSLPEFSTSIKAIAEGHSALAFGNIVGSCFINITLILGVSLIASPLRVNMIVFSDLVIFSLMANLFLWYFLTIGKISWREGAILLFIYLLFLATTLGVISIR